MKYLKKNDVFIFKDEVKMSGEGEKLIEGSEGTTIGNKK